jgi:ElaB/YqjD/DUF883 family membrane-anchored ribosome-binding protein
MRNGHTAQSVKDVQKELKALKAKLNELAESIQDDAAEAGSVLGDGAKAAKHYGEDLLETALDSAKSLGDTAAKHVLTSIKEKPIGTLAALIGIGFLAGYLCRRD